MQSEKDRGDISLVIIAVIVVGIFLTGMLTSFRNTSVSEGILNLSPFSPQPKNSLQLDTLHFNGDSSQPQPSETPAPESIQSSCGYFEHHFPEPSILYYYTFESGGGAGNGYGLKVYYADETFFTLGIGTSSNMQRDAHISHPNVGDLSVRDDNNIPFAPSLFLTDITSNPNDKSGDVQNGGTPISPSDVYGEWGSRPAGRRISANPRVSGTTYYGTPGNGCKLIPFHSLRPVGGDDWPNPIGGACGETEIVWKVSDLSVQSGHTYRAQFTLHDGDYEGDLGEGCAVIKIPQ